MSAIKIDTAPTKEVLAKSYTRDVSVEACILDLVDNSIDAAQTLLREDSPEDLDGHGLPNSYMGYKLNITVDQDSILIKDNCGGMTPATVGTSVLRFGKASTKEYGIGLYGVGLNRAVFKLGDKINIRTTTLADQTEVSFSVAKYLEDPNDWSLPAERSDPVDEPGTIIRIGDLTGQAKRFLSRSSFIKKLGEDIAEIYQAFLLKGLQIEYNEELVEAKVIGIRTDSPFPIQHEKVTNEDNVVYEIVVGQHASHKFSAEPGCKDGQNDHLTPDYGWTITCNDRPILMRNQSNKTGWDGKLHTEHYGFVGYVKFYSQNGDLLPWNTSKTDIDISNAVYQEALEVMKAFAKKWRSFARIAKQYTKEGKALLPMDQQEEPAAPLDSPPAPPPGGSPPKPPSQPKKNWYVLPSDVDEGKCGYKFQSLIDEAKRTNIKNCRYTALAQLRMLFEVGIQDYLIDIKEMRNLTKWINAARNARRKKRGEKPLPAKVAKTLLPELKDICDFLVANPDVWGPDMKNHMTECVNAFINRKGILNSALHKSTQKIAEGVVVDIRDELLPIFKHIIERPNTTDDPSAAE